MEKIENQRQSEKQYFIVLKKVHVNPNTGKEIIEWEKVEATKEQFNEYYRPINAYRKRMQDHGRCIHGGSYGAGICIDVTTDERTDESGTSEEDSP